MDLKKDLISAINALELDKTKQLLENYFYWNNNLDTRSLRKEAKERNLLPLRKKFQFKMVSSGLKHLGMVKLLIRKGFCFNFQDVKSSKKSILHQAIHYNGNEIIIRELLIQGADVDCKESYEMSVCHPQELVEGITPLHFAISRNRENIVKLLVDSGANVNECDGNLNTPLHYAACLDNLQLAKFLFEQGATLNVLNKLGWTPLDFAANRGYKDFSAFLLASSLKAQCDLATDTAFYKATLEGHHEIVKILLDHGTSINAKFSRTNHTALHAAVRSERYEVVKLLLERGIDANIVDDKEDTPLHYFAAKGRETKIAELLLNHGANINKRSCKQKTPLHVAVKNEEILTLKFLLNQGADVFAEDNYGRTPLDEALRHNNSSDTCPYINYKRRAKLLISYAAKLHSDI